jgi:alpha-beta hydrolase superfamily lysophospholipase
VYLDPANAQETGDSGLETIGGNALLLTPGGSENLHHVWDTIPKPTPTAQAIAQACLIAPLPNPTPEPIEAWASESVAAATIAYADMTFIADTQAKEWDIQFADKTKYMKDTKRVQNQQLIKAGARLAILLNSIWPSTRKAAACR